ncbi:MAG: hypothetical protein M3Z75_08930 [Actinomycetota bacterium]|nr:hypothetical protein [Actinomycetota bacterium]
MASNVTSDLQDQILSTIRQSQDMALDALKTWVETVQSIAPSIPAMSIPGADQLPKPHDVVARGYEFAEQMLTNQRKFADQVLDVTSPLLPGEEKSAPKSATTR